jgi:hypothetical protein
MEPIKNLPSTSPSSGSDYDGDENDISQLESPTEDIYTMFNSLSIGEIDDDSDSIRDESGSDYESVSDISDIAQLEIPAEDLSYLVKSTSALTKLLAKVKMVSKMINAYLNKYLTRYLAS